ncbi:MAG: ATP-dependent DNA helicase [Sphaerochaetaceae bacterium]|nr:ATP-dependent DNA helicase [Sphaerochaetaceae bacterium]
MNSKEIFDIFDADGLLSQSLSHFEYREGQQLMAQDAYECLQEKSVYAVEAGTGIGKSFAYLVPVLDRAFTDSEDRTVVATSTINLQKQIMENDIPSLFKAFSKDCQVELAVGRNNYICKRKLKELYESEALLEADGRGRLASFMQFAQISKTGLKTDFKGEMDLEIASEISSDADTCRGPKCPFFNNCFYFLAKRRLSNASVIVCNHHLLLTDCRSRMEGDIDYEEEAVLPPFKHLVVDEAHNLEKNATALFTQEFSNYAIHRQLDYLYSSSSSGKKVDSDRNVLLKLAAFTKAEDLVSDIISCINTVSMLSDAMNEQVSSFMLDTQRMTIYVNKGNIMNLMQYIGTACSNLTAAGNQLVDLLSKLLRKVVLTDETEIVINQFTARLNAVSSLIDIIVDFTRPDKWTEDIHYIENIRRKGGYTVTFNIAPISVAPLLNEHLFKKINNVLCTSATLDLNDDFAFFSRETGLPAESKPFVKKKYLSPFDYKSNLLLLTPSDSVQYNNDDIPSYRQFLCRTIKDAVLSSGGGALVLFTNASLMRDVYETLEVEIREAIGVKCYVQGQMERYRLMETFKKDEDSVLFATNSFWEGVDAPGNTLRLVIITKLPFTMPTDPIFKARSEKLEREENGNGFFHLSLPEAMMRLKQGYGRLMRHADDKGIVLILDSRISNKGYGALMLSNLPESYHPDCRISGISNNIEQFLY